VTKTIDAADNLEAGDERPVEFPRERQHLPEHAIDAKADARQGLLQADRLRQVIDPAGRESLDHFISFRPENGCEQPPVDAIVVNHKDPPAFRLGDGSQFCRICHCVRWAALQLALSRTTARRGLGLTPSCRHSYHRMQIC
jgi:hypothetical protein